VTKLSDLPQTKYWQSFQGYFSGVLKWEDMDRLWALLKAGPEGWFVFDTRQPCPDEPLEPDAFIVFLADSEVYLRARHEYGYCGFIYVDNLEDPAFIKLFDPKRMGSSCGCSGELILPRWIISRIAPEALPVIEYKKKRSFLNWLGR
jgi:hypothetical protein